MQDITSIADLRNTILMLEIKHEMQEEALKEQFKHTYESFKPINLIKGSVKNFVSSPDLTSNLADMAIGLVTGFISKKVLVGGSHNPIVKIIGTLAEIGVAGTVTKNAESIKSIGMSLINKFFSKKKTD